MYFEEDIFSLFITCCACVILAELVVGGIFLRKKAWTLAWFVGHIASIAGAIAVLIRMLFAKRLGIVVPDVMVSEFNSLHLAMFGILWFVSMAFLLATIFAARKNPS